MYSSAHIAHILNMLIWAGFGLTSVIPFVVDECSWLGMLADAIHLIGSSRAIVEVVEDRPGDSALPDGTHQPTPTIRSYRKGELILSDV